MKKETIIAFISGCMMQVLISANITPTTIRPARPITTDVKAFRTLMGLESDIKKHIDKKIKEGYIVKSVAMMDDETMSKAIVVMEKY